MTLSEHWDDTIAESRDDEAQLKRDMRNHPRTSGKSLRELARMCATQGSLHVTRRLDDCYAWLTENRDQLPRELEDDTGARPSSQRLEVSGTDYEQLAIDASELNPANGLFDVGSPSCYLSLEDIAFAGHSYPDKKKSDEGKSVKLIRDYPDAELFAEFGMVPAVYTYLMSKRGETYKDYVQERGRWLRWGCWPDVKTWRGPMRWAVAYDNTVAILESVGRTKMDYLTLPDNLSELFELDGDVLRWKVARGRAAAGSVADRKQIRIDGVDYSRSRIVQYLRTGWVSDYRKVTGTKTLREDGNWDVSCWLGKKQRTIMECHNEQEADQALWAVRWAIDNFQ